MMIGQSERPGALIFASFRKTSAEGEPSVDVFLPLISVPGLIVRVTPPATNTVPSMVMSAGPAWFGQQDSPPAVQVWLFEIVPLMTVPRGIAGPVPWQIGTTSGLPAR